MPEAGKITDLSEEKAKRQIEDKKSNGPDRDTMLYFLGQIMQAEDERDAALKPHKEKLKALKRAAKDHGLYMGELNLVKKMLTKELDETPEEKGKRTAQYLAWANVLPRGFQLELPLSKEATSDEKLEEQGYQAGLMGKDVAHEEGTDAWQKAMVGWHKGQQVLKDRFVKTGADKPKEDPPKTKAKAKPAAKKK